MILPSLTATRYLQPLREGGSLPAVVETEDGGLFVMKFRGAGQGARALVAEIIFVVSSGAMSPAANALAGSPTPPGVSNTEALGNILYTDYFYLFQAAGVVLLIAMIGAIVLTHREREGVKRQRIATQLARDTRTVEIRKVTTGTGI